MAGVTVPGAFTVRLGRPPASVRGGKRDASGASSASASSPADASSGGQASERTGNKRGDAGDSVDGAYRKFRIFEAPDLVKMSARVMRAADSKTVNRRGQDCESGERSQACAAIWRERRLDSRPSQTAPASEIHNPDVGRSQSRRQHSAAADLAGSATVGLFSSYAARSGLQ